MARCVTCHRRLASGSACPEHGGERAGASSSPVAAVPVWTQPVGELVGSGGFASVWAIPGGVLKVAHADHELARSRLAREAEALGAIGAPAVPRLAGHGVLGDGRAWIAMERIAGTSLADLTTAGPLRADKAVALTMGILDALIQVHAARFVHRDLKPDNLVRRADGSVVILDLGLARKLPTDPDDPTRANVQVGSLEYAPPEQLIDAGSVDVRADLYAVGCILYELCAGRPPFIGDAAALERAHAALRPPRLGAVAAVPGAVEAICMDCLAKDPTKRPRDAADLRARLLATRDTPSIARSVPAISQITESKQPVVLVWVELPKVDRAVLAMLTARHVLVISQRGRRVFGALLGSVHADPATTAISLARDLAAAGARVAVHLDALRIDGQTLHGESVAKPESWLPTTEWYGVILTRALASVAQVPTRPADAAGPGFRTLGEVSDAAELFGRDAMLTDLAADAAAALRGNPPLEHRSGSGAWRPTGPAFALLLGDPGVGKTVFAAELGRRLAELGAQVHLATVPAPGAGKPPPLAGLIGTPEGPAVRAIGDALRAAARKRPTAVILDDLHLADHDLLDALEYATLGGESLPLWVLGIAAPRLEKRRPQLGSGAQRRRRDVLATLDEEAAIKMTTALLRPAEYPPMRAVRQLVGLAHNNPLHLTMLAREIHERGAIRRRPGGEFFLDTSALNELEPIALGPWIAARELTALAPELVGLARVCATVGDDFEREELAAVVEAVERSGGPTTTIDLDVGLRELTAAGILIETPRGHAFRQPLVEEGIYATTEDSVRRLFHEAALAYCSAALATAGSIEGRIARHAEAVGAKDVAASAFSRRGELAEREHRAFDAEEAWSGALRNLTERDAARARACLGLGRAQRELQRLHHARTSLEEATAIAREVGELSLEIEALLERAIVLDFAEDYDGSHEVTALARARLADGPDLPRGLVIDVELAEARGTFRAQKFVEAVPLLRTVFEEARRHHRSLSSMVAGLLLGPALADLGELDEAERVFARLMADCEEQGDRFHLAVAYGNRAWLWSARGEIDRIAEDLRFATQLAREAGQAYMERNVTHNLAEHLLWDNQLDEAIQLARRGLALQQRAGEGATSLDRLLLARVLAARGELPELREVLATFSVDERAGDDEAASDKTIEVLHAIASAADAAGWSRALHGIESVFVQMRLELWQLAKRHGQLSDDLCASARQLARTDPVWARRVGEF
ncbi:MAG: protein kinase [Deltaproteobacteria bacterium]|nr:protein kinase [Deltaproteobacteria bacterium]